MDWLGMWAPVTHHESHQLLLQPARVLGVTWGLDGPGLQACLPPQSLLGAVSH